MFGSLLKAVVGVATLPVDVVADVLTLPAKAYNGEELNTIRKSRQIMQNLEDASDAGLK